MVMGPDGKEYGPANVALLKQWGEQNRISPQTMLRDFQTGQTMAASSVTGIFDTVAPPAVSPDPYVSVYQRATTAVPLGYDSQDSGKGELIGSIVRSALGVLVFFLFRGIGLFLAAYAVVYAFRANSKGHRYGQLAIGISLLALVIVIIGWVFRLSTT